MGKREVRYTTLERLTAEKREDGSPVIRGHAAVFNRWADIGGWFKEKIRPGAFKKTIKEADVRALLNHDSNYVLGRNKAGTLRLSEDKKGLAVEIDPPDNQWADDLMVSMKRGDIDQMSFGFDSVKEEWDSDLQERELVEVRLFDVSVVTFPAYDQTDASVRSIIAMPDEVKPNLDHLTGLFFRVSRDGYRITDKDLELLKEHMELCRSLMPAQSEPENHSDTEEEPEIDHSAMWLREQAKITESIINFSL